jgi:hypothetical protein
MSAGLRRPDRGWPGARDPEADTGGIGEGSGVSGRRETVGAGPRVILKDVLSVAAELGNLPLHLGLDVERRLAAALAARVAGDHQ